MKQFFWVSTIGGSVLSLMLGASSAFAGEAPLVGDATAGAAKAVTCSACHGAAGMSLSPEWPNLAAQHHEYTQQQLGYLKSGVRVAAVMNAMAAALSPQDMADLASYFEKQTPTGLEGDATLAQAGEKLYRGGVPSRHIPSCMGCHGPNGRGNGPAKWPQIRGQNATYVATQLNHYAENARYTTVAGQPAVDANAAIMTTIAMRLQPDEIKALAAYVQGLR
jgi:cytochrome c553